MAVAMKNAIAEERFNADYVTTKTNDEDGVSEFLEILLDAKKSALNLTSAIAFFIATATPTFFKNSRSL